MLKKVKAILRAAESMSEEDFFRRIAAFLPTLDYRYQAIQKAYDVAKFEFDKIIRDSGVPYFEHLRAVALILIVYMRVKDYRLIVAALLHDLVEEIPSWTIERVKAEFGLEVAVLVEWMTKPKEEFPNKEERNKVYYTRFHSAPRDFFLIKLADRLHNLITLWAKSREDIIRKLEETKLYYLPFAEQYFILFHELEAAIKENERKLKIAQ